jgi:hypothetical protein
MKLKGEGDQKQKMIKKESKMWQAERKEAAGERYKEINRKDIGIVFRREYKLFYQ